MVRITAILDREEVPAEIKVYTPFREGHDLVKEGTAPLEVPRRWRGYQISAEYEIAGKRYSSNKYTGRLGYDRTIRMRMRRTARSGARKRRERRPRAERPYRAMRYTLYRRPWGRRGED